jgi:hypothetical protein
MGKKIKGALERVMVYWDFLRMIFSWHFIRRFGPSIARALFTGEEVRTVVGKIGPKPGPENR